MGQLHRHFRYGAVIGKDNLQLCKHPVFKKAPDPTLQMYFWHSTICYDLFLSGNLRSKSRQQQQRCRLHEILLKCFHSMILILWLQSGSELQKKKEIEKRPKACMFLWKVLQVQSSVKNRYVVCWREATNLTSLSQTLQPKCVSTSAEHLPVCLFSHSYIIYYILIVIQQC